MGQSGCFNFGWATRRKTEFKPALLCFKTDLESHPAYNRGAGRIYVNWTCIWGGRGH